MYTIMVWDLNIFHLLFYRRWAGQNDGVLKKVTCNKEAFEFCLIYKSIFSDNWFNT